MKITDTLVNMLVSGLLKKGILYEAKNCDITFEVPQEGKNNIKISFKADNMTLKVEKD